MTDRKGVVLSATSAALIVAANSASASLPDADILMESDIGAATDEQPVDVADLLAPLPDIWPNGAEAEGYLVAEQHDGTWVGGGGGDVIRESPRRSFMDRLRTGNALGGMALLGGIVLAGWALLRRGKR